MSAVPAIAAISDLPENVILEGDALAVLRTLPDNSVDALVTDPPAGIAFMGKHWDSDRGGRDQWIAWLAEILREAWRVTKPGGHALVWALPRTSHWTAMALEDAGWDVRDRLAAIQGQGFPKSLDPYKAAQKSGMVCQCQIDVVHYPYTKSKGEAPHGHVPDLREATAEDATKPTPEILLDSVCGQSEALTAGCEDMRNMRQGVATTNTLSGGAQYGLLPRMQQQAHERTPQGNGTPARSSLPVLRQSVSSEVAYSSKQGTPLQRPLRGQASHGEHRTHRTSTQDSAVGTRRLDRQQPPIVSPEDERREEPGMEGRRDVQAHTRQLSGRDVRQMPSGISANGAQGWLRDGASASDGTEDRTMPSPRRSRASHRPQPSEQSPRQSATLPQQPRPQTCRSCGKPIWPHEPGALGTALKPAVEDWWLCRKPLSEKNVAANVLRWGTGALNIGASRVESGRDYHDLTVTQGVNTARTSWEHRRQPRTFAPSTGRFPANLLLSHSIWCTDAACADGCPVRALDAQSGERGLSKKGSNNGTARGMFGLHNTANSNGAMGYGDTGGASRYFQTFRYQAKASRAERNRGCEDMGARRKSNYAPNDPNENKLQTRLHGSVERTGNHHPTVKSLQLMSWLITLITPPGGIVLDCFAGSGSTLVAAKAGGWRYIGIEREAEYVAIAEARLGAAPSPLQTEKPKPKCKRTSKKAPQLHLLEGVSA